MDIPQIKIGVKEISTIDIPNVYTPEWLKKAPTVIGPTPPVTQQVGVPIINMPGCVEAHEQNTNRERSGVLQEDDPNGVKVFCDAGIPSYNPIDYDKDKIEYEYEAPVPPVNPPPEAELGDTPEIPPTTAPTCPTEKQELTQPVGTLTDSGTKKITEYRLVGTECIPIKEDITITDQIIKGIPSTNQVTTTASIAVVATAAAAATPLLLRVVKPIVKQLIKKVQRLLGKEPPKLSANERQTNRFREKRGLPPFKRPKARK